jgi:hypothetical protein
MGIPFRIIYLPDEMRSYGKIGCRGEQSMKTMERAIETTATINADHQLVLDEPLPVAGPVRVRVIVFLSEQPDIEEAEWLRAGTNSGVFDFLNAPEEDLYTLADGRTFRD